MEFEKLSAFGGGSFGCRVSSAVREEWPLISTQGCGVAWETRGPIVGAGGRGWMYGKLQPASLLGVNHDGGPRCFLERSEGSWWSSYRGRFFSPRQKLRDDRVAENSFRRFQTFV